MEFFEMFDGNLPALAVIGFVMLLCAIVPSLISNGYLSRMLKSRGKGRSAAELAERMDKIEDGFVPDLGEVLGRIDGKLDAMQESMTEMETRLNYADKSALMGVIYNDRIHRVDRLRAFINYLKLGGNGLVAEYAIEELVRPNRDDWTRAVQESRMTPRCDKYHERIAEINRRLHGAGD